MKKQNIISWIALALSIIACIITWVRVDVYFTNDTFVGIMAGFMGACATIVVGAQIYNSIETSKKIKEIEALQKKVNNDIETLKQERETIVHFTINKTKISLGISTSRERPFFAYKQFFYAFKEALILDKTTFINSSLNNIEILCKRIKENRKLKLPSDFDLELCSPDKIKKHKSYPLVKDRYTKCYEIILETDKRCQEQSETAS